MGLPTDTCTGCSACFNICPKNALIMKENKEGFLYPHKLTDICVDCGLCEQVCPALNEIEPYDEAKDIYAAWNTDEDIRMDSSSGGVFSALANTIIESGGVVYGASLVDGRTDLRHMRVDSLGEVKMLSKSKYFQSYIGNCYRTVKSDLASGINVLFTGTPCQITGLKSFLNISRGGVENLYTVEILCHGVPSAKVIKHYIEMLETVQKKKLRTIYFRHKDENHGWKVSCCCCLSWEDGTMTLEESTPDSVFWNGFLGNLFLRKSCGTCAYCRKERVADLTIGDYWGIWEDKKYSDVSEKGVSLVAVNSLQGGKLFSLFKNRIDYGIASKYIAYKNNLTFEIPFQESAMRSYFFEHLDKVRFDRLIKKCFRSKYIKLRIKKLLGYRLTTVVSKSIHKGNTGTG